MVYVNPQGTGIFVVFKFNDGELDTGSYSGSYRYKPPARIYNTAGKAKAQWTRFKKEGWQPRAAEIWIEDGAIQGQWVDEDWKDPVDLCGHTQRIDSASGGFMGYRKCKLDKGHDGIHKVSRR